MLENIHDDFLKVLSLSFVIQGNLKMSEPFWVRFCRKFSFGARKGMFYVQYVFCYEEVERWYGHANVVLSLVCKSSLKFYWFLSKCLLVYTVGLPQVLVYLEEIIII